MKISPKIYTPFILMAIFVLAGCSNDLNGPSGKGGSKAAQNLKPQHIEGYAVTTDATEIKAVTYNLLNLFDANHDEGKLDYTFLPKGYPGKKEYCDSLSNSYYAKLCRETDWSEKRFRQKLVQIEKVIQAQGSLPDLLAVQEIENNYATEELAKKLGYQKQLTTNSPDKRGIDVALLYRTEKLIYLEHEEIVLQGEGLPTSFVTKPTRNILRVHFRIEGADPNHVLGVYVNHWPSQSAKPEKRMAVANVMRKHIDEQTARIGRPNYFVIALGDFNTLTREHPNAFHNVIEDPNWNNALVDTQYISLNSKHPMNGKMPRHSYWYWRNNSWDKLDRILVSQNLWDKKGAEILPDSFRIVAHPFMTRTFQFKNSKTYFEGSTVTGVPMRYDFMTDDESKRGYSDHLPVSIKIQIR